MWQNTTLFKWLKLKKDNSGVKIIGLDEAIAEAKSAMSAEEVAYVEKLVAEL
jgi:ABC-type arginine transport system permease subunit